MKRTYVYDEATGQMVEIQRPRRPLQAPLVIDDIEPFRSPINGYKITSRPKFKAHMRMQGLDPTGLSSGWIEKARARWPAVQHACKGDLNRIGRHFETAFRTHFADGRRR